MDTKIQKSPMRWIEIVFDLLYLFTVLLSAFLLFKTSETDSIRRSFAIMSFILGAGDSFHLVPRILSLLDKNNKDYRVSLGIGKLITSISMTIFYVILWNIGVEYYRFNISTGISIFIYALALIRIILCFFPQNQWLDKKPSIRWGVIRNIPFVLLGASVMALFLTGASMYGGSLSYLWLAILISFACYLPVVLFAQKNPKIGMLMLPKSCAYIWIVLMGFSVF